MIGAFVFLAVTLLGVGITLVFVLWTLIQMGRGLHK